MTGRDGKTYWRRPGQERDARSDVEWREPIRCQERMQRMALVLAVVNKVDEIGDLDDLRDVVADNRDAFRPDFLMEVRDKLDQLIEWSKQQEWPS